MSESEHKRLSREIADTLPSALSDTDLKHLSSCHQCMLAVVEKMHAESCRGNGTRKRDPEAERYMRASRERFEARFLKDAPERNGTPDAAKIEGVQPETVRSAKTNRVSAVQKKRVGKIAEFASSSRGKAAGKKSV